MVRPLRHARRPDSATLAGAAAAAAADVTGAPAAPVPPDPRTAAFFDVDNTMMMGASLYHFARGMAARKYFTTRDLARFAWQQLTFRISGESSQDITATREAALAFVAGMKVTDIVRLGGEIYDEVMAERIWSGTRALAQQHLDAG